MDGFYAAYFTGEAGFGFALLIFDRETIVGVDETGVQYDGSYKESEDRIFVRIQIRAPAGVTLVTGQSLSAPTEQLLSTSMGRDFANGQHVELDTEMGRVNVIFKKLKDLP
ncbi:hypothetical protein [Cereibacter sphaeroides]|jgi:hypothetical protein|uniref:hypothetical protein n=1 Tax=Cereibacter sphaeroides TaxID=1063 RepID=UPI0000F2A17D|nr:hypothetical protein [Cereibacter sphaeroides]ABN78106.1 hypothetical protein Rsph17029_3006 [Cereibacter sphaeroides ATCC 17029]